MEFFFFAAKATGDSWELEGGGGDLKGSSCYDVTGGLTPIVGGEAT